jgi:hypothetical protein
MNRGRTGFRTLFYLFSVNIPPMTNNIELGFMIAGMIEETKLFAEKVLPAPR